MYFTLVLIYFPIIQVAESHFILHSFKKYFFLTGPSASVNNSVCALIVFHIMGRILQ